MLNLGKTTQSHCEKFQDNFFRLSIFAIMLRAKWDKKSTAKKTEDADGVFDHWRLTFQIFREIINLYY
jgi:hypothetical protein